MFVVWGLDARFESVEGVDYKVDCYCGECAGLVSGGILLVGFGKGYFKSSEACERSLKLGVRGCIGWTHKPDVAVAIVHYGVMGEVMNPGTSLKSREQYKPFKKVVSDFIASLIAILSGPSSFQDEVILASRG